MRPIKREPGVGEGEEVAEEQAQQQQQQQQEHPSQRRKVDDDGLAALQTRSHIEAQAAAFQGMEQVRVMGLELQHQLHERGVKGRACQRVVLALLLLLLLLLLRLDHVLVHGGGRWTRHKAQGTAEGAAGRQSAVREGRDQ